MSPSTLSSHPLHDSCSTDKIEKSKGLAKLEKFCRAAKEHDCHWAWSDTCCIDKGNDLIEMQEAVGSMFSWYRQSALTIIYLVDVSPNASPRELFRSQWFRRGWTLQELLASQRVLFYSRDWSLAGKVKADTPLGVTSSNHSSRRRRVLPLRYL